MSEHAKASFTIVNLRGLHARAASKLCRLASTFPCDVTLSGPEEAGVSAKSVMGVLLLCGSRGTVVSVEARGERANEAVTAIGQLIADRFGESE